MKVEIERFREPGGILRVWVDPNAKHGDPYHFVLTVRWISDEAVEFLGLLRQGGTDGEPIIPHEMWRSILNECARQGIKRIKFVRMTNGVERVRWKLTKSRRGSQ